jgi:hypothetical protein
MWSDRLGLLLVLERIGMFRMKIVCMVFALAMAASQSQAAMVAYWSFNETFPPASTSMSFAPTLGAGTADLALNFVNVGTFSGTTLNAVGATPAGTSLRIGNGEFLGDPLNNGSTLTLGFSLQGMMNPIISMASRRSHNSFEDVTVDYSTDGINFTSFAGNFAGGRGGRDDLVGNPFTLKTIDLTGLGFQQSPNAFVRLTFNGAISGSAVFDVDNIKVNASAVPEPASLALVSLGCGLGVVMKKRRRRAAAASPSV